MTDSPVVQVHDSLFDHSVQASAVGARLVRIHGAIPHGLMPWAFIGLITRKYGVRFGKEM
jgi:hypothetical protein